LPEPRHTEPSLHAAGISLSIVAYRTPLKLLEGAIRSAFVALQTAGLEADSLIVVVDNGEDGEQTKQCLLPLTDTLKSAGCGFEYLHGHGNIGYGAAHNLSFQREHRPVHVFMNPDVVLDPDVFVRGCAYLESNADVAMISPEAIDDAGSRQFLCKRYPSVFDLLLRGFGPGFLKKVFARRLARYEMRDLSTREASKEVPIISGCFMLCRSEQIRQAKGFDPDFFLYFEDFDLSLRMSRRAKLAFLPDMKIRHSGGNSARKGVAHIFMFLRSARRFFSLHGWRWI